MVKKTRSLIRENQLGLYTDKYELTMLDAFIKNDMHEKKAVFELFARKLPPTRKHGVVVGTARAIEAITRFQFSETDLDYLSEFLSPKTIEYLTQYSFNGTVIGYREGDYWFPYSPILTVHATLGEAVILETLLLSIFNYDSAVASAASHMVQTAKGHMLMEFGARRVNEQAAVVASRAAYIAGFTATSNLKAGKEYNIPVFGTSAHAFTLAFPTEKEAFQAQVDAYGTSTTLLVDTYDIAEGISNAVEVAGTDLYAIRIDSGDPYEVIPAAREQLDSLGAVNTKIVLSGDITLNNLQQLIDAELPIDSYGVGTDVVTGSGAVAAGFVYKMVSIEQNGVMVNVAKTASGNKKSVGGSKTVYREFDENWEIIAEQLVTDEQGGLISSDWERIQTVYMAAGKVVSLPTVEEARALHTSNINENHISDNVTVKVNDDPVWVFQS